MGFNRAITNECIDQDQDQDQASTRILALDASFLPKSGKKTYGLDHFWNGCHSRKEKGLEICALAIVDVDKNTAFTLSVAQSAPTIAKKEAETEDEETRIDQYLQHLQEVCPYLEEDDGVTPLRMLLPNSMRPKQRRLMFVSQPVAFH